MRHGKADTGVSSRCHLSCGIPVIRLGKAGTCLVIAPWDLHIADSRTGSSDTDPDRQLLQGLKSLIVSRNLSLSRCSSIRIPSYTSTRLLAHSVLGPDRPCEAVRQCLNVPCSESRMVGNTSCWPDHEQDDDICHSGNPLNFCLNGCRKYEEAFGGHPIRCRNV